MAFHSGGSRDAPEVVETVDAMACRKPSSKQPSIAKALGANLAKHEMQWCPWWNIFFYANIAPHKATSPYLKIMLDAATEHGPGIKPPMAYEIDVYYV